MKTVVVLAVAIVANTLGNLCLSMGMKQFGVAEPGVAWVIQTGFHVVSNPWLILGVLFLLVFLAAYLTALSWADLSFVLPATAPAYLLNAALSKFFLHESISPTRWAGTILIVTGTWLVARTYSNSSSSRACAQEPELVSAGATTRGTPGADLAPRSGD